MIGAIPPDVLPAVMAVDLHAASRAASAALLPPPPAAASCILPTAVLRPC